MSLAHAGVRAKERVAMLMHKSFVLIVSSSVFGFVACSSTSAPLGTDEDAGTSSPTIDAGASVDSSIVTTIDSGSSIVDAGIDSGPVITGEFSCAGDPLPTTAPTSITIGGTVDDRSISGTTALDGVMISAYPSQTSTTALANASSDASGTFSIAVGTGGSPLDGYLKASKAGELDTYLYPNAPLAASTSGLSVVMLTSTTYGFLALGGGVTQDDSKGVIAVIVLDCNAQPVAGATVTTSPAGTVRYNGTSGPSATATATSDGLAYIFNVPAGDVTVSATAGSVSLRTHHLISRAGAFTTTLITP